MRQGPKRNVITYGQELGARLRVERGITQTELARRAGILPRTVARIEEDGIDSVRVVHALAYCGALGLTIEEVYFNKRNEETNNDPE